MNTIRDFYWNIVKEWDIIITSQNRSNFTIRRVEAILDNGVLISPIGEGGYRKSKNINNNCIIYNPEFDLNNRLIKIQDKINKELDKKLDKQENKIYKTKVNFKFFPIGTEFEINEEWALNCPYCNKLGEEEYKDCYNELKKIVVNNFSPNGRLNDERLFELIK